MAVALTCASVALLLTLQVFYCDGDDERYYDIINRDYNDEDENVIESVTQYFTGFLCTRHWRGLALVSGRGM